MALTVVKPSGIDTTGNFTVNGMTVSANLSAANANITNLVTTGNINFAGVSNVNLGSVSNLHITGGTANYVLSTDGAGNLSWVAQTGGGGSGTPGGANTQIQFNDSGTFGGNANLTFNKTTSVLTITGNISALNANLGNAVVANYFSGSGNLLSNIQAANITGTVANATQAATANTVVNAAQPNITSVGLLTSLSVGPNSGITLTGTSGYVRANSIQGTDGVAAIYPAYGGVTGAAGIAGNLTVGTGAAGNITANGNVTASYFIGNGSSLSSITGANVTGTVATATTAGTVTTAAQPNITSVGTLTDINVSGNAVIGGNLTVSGTTTYVNVTNLVVSDPLIQLQSGPNGAAPASNTGKDVGTALNYYDTQARVAFMGWDVSNAEFGFGNAVSISSEVVTFTSYGNVRAGYFIGNGSSLSSITGANVTGQVANALVAGTVYTNAQPNITSVGSLTGLTSNGTIDFTSASNVSLGSVTNIKITGGAANYVLSTDGSGNLSWSAAATATSTSTTDAFTGNGVATSFTLSVTPSSKDWTVVNYNGAIVLRSDYTLTGNVISFTNAPANGARIEVTTVTLTAGGGGGGGSSTAATVGYALVFGG